MELYPEVLVSQQAKPVLDEKVVSAYYFIRKTDIDLYPLLKIYTPLELIDKILPNTTKRDVFVLSVSLYGYYDESHIAINVSDKTLNNHWIKTMADYPIEQIEYTIESWHPLFLQAKKLYERPFSFEGEMFYLSFWHKPTIVNYWHFQLFTRDSNGEHLPRDQKPGEKETKAEGRKLRRLATTILEYLISESICSFSETRKFYWEAELGS